jgi:hypothetical protein
LPSNSAVHPACPDDGDEAASAPEIPASKAKASVERLILSSLRFLGAFPLLSHIVSLPGGGGKRRPRVRLGAAAQPPV